MSVSGNPPLQQPSILSWKTILSGFGITLLALGAISPIVLGGVDLKEHFLNDLTEVGDVGMVVGGGIALIAIGVTTYFLFRKKEVKEEEDKPQWDSSPVVFAEPEKIEESHYPEFSEEREDFLTKAEPLLLKLEKNQFFCFSLGNNTFGMAVDGSFLIFSSHAALLKKIKSFQGFEELFLVEKGKALGLSTIQPHYVKKDPIEAAGNGAKRFLLIRINGMIAYLKDPKNKNEANKRLAEITLEGALKDLTISKVNRSKFEEKALEIKIAALKLLKKNYKARGDLSKLAAVRKSLKALKG